MSIWHDLKCYPEYFEAVIQKDVLKRKTVEIRFEDRDYNVGDILKLKEWFPIINEYSGREAHVRITHCLRSIIYLPVGYVALSINLIFPSRWDDDI